MTIPLLVFSILLFVFSAEEPKKRRLSDYNRQVRESPNDPQAYFARAEYYYSKRKPEKSLADYDRAVELVEEEEPLDEQKITIFLWRRATAYTRLQRFEKALDDLNRAISFQPDSSAIFLADRAEIYTHTKDYENAISDMTKLVNMNPTWASLYPPEECERYNMCGGYFYFARGKLYYAVEKYAMSVVDHGQAIEINENYTEAYLERSQSYYMLRDFLGAIRDLNRVIDLTPKEEMQSLFFYLRGKAHAALQKYSFATLDFNIAENVGTMTPLMDLLAYERGLAYFNEGELDDAEKDFLKVLALHKDNPEQRKHVRGDNLYFHLGNVYKEKGKYADAAEVYTSAILLNDKREQFFFNRGVVLNLDGLTEEALEDVTQAIQLTLDKVETSPQGASLVGKILKSKDPEEEEFVNLYYERGLLFKALGRNEEMNRDFEIALEIEPENEDAKKAMKCEAPEPGNIHINLDDLDLDFGEVDEDEIDVDLDEL